MLKVSLIVATLGERPDELCALLQSLPPQVPFISNIVVVDQHPDRRVVPGVLRQFENLLPLHHTRSERGLSRARNHGLPLVTGGLVAFPDDDCLYPDGLLAWVVNWFETQVEYDILAVGVKDAEGIRSGNRWPQNSCDVRPLNALRTTFSSSLFMWSDLAKSARFDTTLGVGAGTPFGSGEETDYVLRLLRGRARGRFDRTRHIIHPRRDMLSGHTSKQRAQAYGFGMGHLLRRHKLRNLWLGFMGYNVARAGIGLFGGNASGAALCLAQTKGMWNGFNAQYTPSPSLVANAAAPRTGTRAMLPAGRHTELLQTQAESEPGQNRIREVEAVPS
jgi:glycosyltransferase involved in cell wall biosynthesis